VLATDEAVSAKLLKGGAKLGAGQVGPSLEIAPGDGRAETDYSEEPAGRRGQIVYADDGLGVRLGLTYALLSPLLLLPSEKRDGLIYGALCLPSATVGSVGFIVHQVAKNTTAVAFPETAGDVHSGVAARSVRAVGRAWDTNTTALIGYGQRGVGKNDHGEIGSRVFPP
jgi:hypothetical protein